jgi:hypothetical protein
MSEQTIRSRRALLVGAAGGAAAIAANAALPASRALAVDQPLLVNVPNAATANTSLTGAVTTNPILTVENTNVGSGGGIWGKGADGPGVAGSASTNAPGVTGLSGDDSGAPSNTALTGVFGYAQAGDGVNTIGTGVWGVSDDVGVYGGGGTGVFGDGGDSGDGLAGYSKNGYGLYVTGKVKFSNRSGRISVAKGKTSISKSVPGMSSSNVVIAVLQQAETGTWVRAAVAATGKFTVYFNRALPSASVVGWLVLN